MKISRLILILKIKNYVIYFNFFIKYIILYLIFFENYLLLSKIWKKKILEYKIYLIIFVFNLLLYMNGIIMQLSKYYKLSKLK